MDTLSRRRFLQASGAMVASGALTGVGILPKAVFAAEPVKLGLLHSLTGTIAIAEAALVDAENLAIEEINSAGGVMGRKIEPIVEKFPMSKINEAITHLREGKARYRIVMQA